MRRGWQELLCTLYSKLLYMDMRVQSHLYHFFVVNSTVLLALFLLQSSWTTCVDCKSIIQSQLYRFDHFSFCDMMNEW